MEDESNLTDSARERLECERKLLKYESKMKKAVAKLRTIDPNYTASLIDSATANVVLDESVATPKEKMLNGDLFLKMQQNKELEDKWNKLKEQYDHLEGEYKTVISSSSSKDLVDEQLAKIRSLEQEIEKLKAAMQENEEAYIDRILNLEKLIKQTRSSMTNMHDSMRGKHENVPKVEYLKPAAMTESDSSIQNLVKEDAISELELNNEMIRDEFVKSSKFQDSEMSDHQDLSHIKPPVANTQVSYMSTSGRQSTNIWENNGQLKDNSLLPMFQKNVESIKRPSQSHPNNLENELQQTMFNDKTEVNDNELYADEGSVNSVTVDESEKYLDETNVKRRSVSYELLSVGQRSPDTTRGMSNNLVPLYHNIELIDASLTDIQVSVEVSASGLLYVTTDVPINNEIERILRKNYDKLDQMTLEDFREILQNNDIEAPSGTAILQRQHITRQAFMTYPDDAPDEENTVPSEDDIPRIILPPPEHTKPKDNEIGKVNSVVNVLGAFMRDNDYDENQTALKDMSRHDKKRDEAAKDNHNSTADVELITNIIEESANIQKDLKTTLSRSQSLHNQLEQTLAKTENLSKQLLNSGNTVLSALSHQSNLDDSELIMQNSLLAPTKFREFPLQVNFVSGQLHRLSEQISQLSEQLPKTLSKKISVSNLTNLSNQINQHLMEQSDKPAQPEPTDPAPQLNPDSPSSAEISEVVFESTPHPIARSETATEAVQQKDPEMVPETSLPTAAPAPKESPKSIPRSRSPKRLSIVRTQEPERPAPQRVHQKFGLWERDLPPAPGPVYELVEEELKPEIERRPREVVPPEEQFLELSEIPTKEISLSVDLVPEISLSRLVEMETKEEPAETDDASSAGLSFSIINGLQRSLEALRNISLFRPVDKDQSEHILDPECLQTTKNIERKLKEQKTLIADQRRHIAADTESLTQFLNETTKKLSDGSAVNQTLNKYRPKVALPMRSTWPRSDAVSNKFSEPRRSQIQSPLIPNMPIMTEKEFMARRLPSPVKIISCESSNDNRLIITWKIFTITQVKGYEIFCDGLLVRKVHVPVRNSCIINVPDPKTEQLISIYAIPDNEFLSNGPPFHFAPHSFFYVPK